MCKSLSITALLAVMPLVQAGQVEVRFVQPDSYSDANQGVEAERTRQDISEYLTRLGEKLVPPRQSVLFEILDVDLAGEIQYTSRVFPPPRVLLGKADWPSITLRYTLSENGRTVRQGEERVIDMDYLDRGSLPPSMANESLAYEKRMLGEWFRLRLAN